MTMVLARFQRTIVDALGNVLPAATITVRKEIAGAPLAVLYTDRAGTTPLGNPFAADGDGFAAFHTAGGAFRITAASGATSIDWRYVGIGTASEFDAGGIPALVQEVDAGYALRFEGGTSAPPSAGAIRFNNANLGLATQAYVSVENLAESSIAQRLLELYDPARTIKDTFTIADPATNRQASFQIGNAVPVGSPATYITLTVGAHAGATSFTAGERVNFQPNRAGADGADGADGTVENVRLKLSANRTYYVRSDGNDSNNGLADAPGGAFLTAQKAADVVYGTLDLGGFDVDIQVRDGTFGRFVVPFPQVGKGAITLRGNAGAPANVTLTAALATTVSGVIDVQNYAVLAVRDLTLTGTGSGQCMFASLGGNINFTDVRFGTFTGGGHMLASQGGQITATGNYSIVGGTGLHWWANDRGSIRVQSRTVTITGTPAFSGAFVQADYAGIATVNGNTYVGGATGIRFNAANNGVVVAFGGLTELPGSVAGNVTSGGIHPALVDYATDAQVRSAAAGRFVMTVDKIETASAFVNMTDAATIAFDWDAGIVRSVVMAGDRALGNPSNNQPGTWRTIWLIGDSATPRTLTFGGNLVGNNAPITGITSTQRVLIHVLALDPTFAWVSPPSGKF